MEDGLSRQALAGSRALQAAAWTIGVGSTAHGITAWSRSSSFWHQAPAPQLNPDGFVSAVNDAIDEVGYELVFGARDADVMVLSSRRQEIRARVPYAAHSVLLRLLDKLELLDRAQASGIATPATLPATHEVVTALAAAFVLAAVGYFGVVASPEAKARVTEVAGGTGRVDIWRIGWRMVQDEPLRGVGSGNFKHSSVRYLLQPGAIERADFASTTRRSRITPTSRSLRSLASSAWCSSSGSSAFPCDAR